jgi:hypothetical protein
MLPTLTWCVQSTGSRRLDYFSPRWSARRLPFPPSVVFSRDGQRPRADRWGTPVNPELAFSEVCMTSREEVILASFSARSILAASPS